MSIIFLLVSSSLPLSLSIHFLLHSIFCFISHNCKYVALQILSTQTLNTTTYRRVNGTKTNKREKRKEKNSHKMFDFFTLFLKWLENEKYFFFCLQIIRQLCVLTLFFFCCCCCRAFFYSVFAVDSKCVCIFFRFLLLKIKC